MQIQIRILYKPKPKDTYPTRIRIVENLIQLFIDNLTILLERTLQKDEFGEFPTPTDRRYVLNDFLCVRFAIAQHQTLLAEDPTEKPINFVRVIHQQQRVLL